MKSALLHVLFAAPLAVPVLLTAPGCSDSGTTTVACEGEIVVDPDGTQRCIPSGNGGNGGNGGTAGNPGGAGGNPGGAGGGTGGGDPDATTDNGPDPEQNCDEAIAGTKPFGAACAAHCECVTGYCDNEGYLGDFRFCTRLCDGDCDEGTDCIILGGNLAKTLGVSDDKDSLCVPTCSSLDDCKLLSSEYDTCGNPGPTKDSRCLGTTLTLDSTCQIIAECYPDE